MQSKKIEIFVIIVTMLTTLVSVVGLTFAYFTTQVYGNTPANVTISSAKLGSMTFNAGGDIEADMNYDDTLSKTFSLTVAPSDLEQHVKVNIVYSNEIDDIEYTTTMTGVTVGGNAVSENLTSIVTNNINNGTFDSDADSETLTILTINVKPNSSTVVLNYRLDIFFGTNGGGSGEFTGTLTGALDTDRMYYYNDYRSGSSLPS